MSFSRIFCRMRALFLDEDNDVMHWTRFLSRNLVVLSLKSMRLFVVSLMEELVREKECVVRREGLIGLILVMLLYLLALMVKRGILIRV